MSYVLERASSRFPLPDILTPGPETSHLVHAGKKLRTYYPNAQKNFPKRRNEINASLPSHFAIGCGWVRSLEVLYLWEFLELRDLPNWGDQNARSRFLNLRLQAMVEALGRVEARNDWK